VKRKVTWKKGGAYKFAGFATVAETGQKMLLYYDGKNGLLATAFKESDEFSQAGMRKDHMFDFTYR